MLVAGIAVGYATTAPYGVTAEGPADVAGVFGAVAVGPFVTIAANNWVVSAGLAYGGLAFGLPAVSGLAFNGVLVGALAGVFDRTAFLALVAPHGVLELPVIAVAGGLGLHLGGVGWRAVRGETDAERVAGAGARGVGARRDRGPAGGRSRHRGVPHAADRGGGAGRVASKER
ncbi:stage II sporulation protein M [Halobaculum litoreum]|uniref:Stage II sporulation protein M n=1 Tax=Halobaculum litoreum TaxID=3031998 RepID=A0ABD5XRM7_9EURY